MEVNLVWTALVLVSGSMASSDYYLVILHQSDIHSAYGTVDFYGVRCRNTSFQMTTICHFGGFPRAVQYVKDTKGDPYSPNVLTVNSGDFFTGDTMHTAFKGELASAMVRHMPYDAIGVGNKDFAEGLDGLVAFMRAISSVFVCTNMNFGGLNSTLKAELLTLCPPHRIITLSGKKIAIFGYVSPRAVSIVKTGGIILENEVQALNREVAVVQEQGVHILIALGHSGYERDKEIAVQVPGLDVIVGGHSHSLLWNDLFSEQAVGRPADPADKAVGPYPTVVRTGGRVILIVHSYWAGKYLGNINVTFDDSGEVKDWWPQPVLMRPGMPEDPGARSTLDDFERRYEKWSRTPVGFSYVQLVGTPDYCFHGECSMGNLLTDAMLWALRVDAGDEPARLPMVALLNSGAIQNSLPLGNITPKIMDTALPWRNHIDVVTLSGRVLREAFEFGVSIKDKHGKLLQVSGARVVYDLAREVGARVLSVEILCRDCPIPFYEPLNDSRRYVVATSKYIIEGGDGFDVLTRYESRAPFELMDMSVLYNYLLHTSPVYPVIEGRVVVLHGGGDGEEESSAAARTSHTPAVGALALLLVLRA